MTLPHRHNEIELNFIEAGSITYLFGGTPLRVAPGRLSMFWAAMPHRMIAFEPSTILSWLTVPLAWFLQWQLPEPLTTRLLAGEPIVERDHARRLTDQALVLQWQHDLERGISAGRKAALLEIEARLWRLALSLATGRRMDSAHQRDLHESGHHKARAMARFVSARHAEEMRVAEIAGAVGLQPSYAMSLFRRTYGVTIVDYLTQCRVAHAQRLLATTDAGVLDVALEAGFSSMSRFYAAFSRACGVPPRVYRAGLRA